MCSYKVSRGRLADNRMVLYYVVHTRSKYESIYTYIVIHTYIYMYTTVEAAYSGTGYKISPLL